MASKTKVSVIIPVKNEQGNILPLIKEIEAALTLKYDFEIIYINDGSTDDSLKELRAAKKAYKFFRIINHYKSYGQSAAIRSGVSAANNEIICMLDGDGQNDPINLQEMIEKYKAAKNDKVLIAGWRHKRQDSKGKKLTSKLANAIRSKLLKDKTPDTGCGIKVFSKSLFLSFPYFDHIHRYFPALTLMKGGKVISVKVTHRQRGQGQSNYGFWDRLLVSLLDIIGVYWLIKRNPTVKSQEVK